MLPLDGVRVLDFTHGVAGPYATMILADLGCDVIKIERPGRGDATRYMNVSERFRSAIPRVGGDYFMAINRNKRSICIDLTSSRGRQLALDLALSADVVCQSFRPGVMERLGLDERTMFDLKSQLIYASLSAYGDQGPLAHQPGMDVAVQARSGVMSITGQEGGTSPIKPGVSLADFSGGAHLAIGVLAALFKRSASGSGESVRVSLLDATMAMLMNYSVAVMDGGAELTPMGSGHPQLAPFEAVRTRDGFLVVATGTNRLYRNLCDELGRPDLLSDPRFESNESRVRNRAALMESLEKEFQKQTTAHWLSRLERVEIPCAPVNSMKEALSEEQLIANGMLESVVHPELGSLSQLGSPYVLGHQRPPLNRPPPRLGEHTREVLRDLLDIGTEEFNLLLLDAVVGE